MGNINKVLEKLLLPLAILFLIFSIFLGGMYFCIFEEEISKEEYIDISNVWYESITYNGYIEYYDTYEYTITWRQLNEDGTTSKMFKVVSLTIPPSKAIKIIEDNKQEFTEGGFEIVKSS